MNVLGGPGEYDGFPWGSVKHSGQGFPHAFCMQKPHPQGYA